jgi:phosphoserine phosphatase RsbU/P
MPRGYLICTRTGQRLPVDATRMLGRADNCDLFLEDASASRHHLQVFPRGEGFAWKDLGSTNGTLLNGKPMLEGPLQDGDELQVGDLRIRFECHEGTASDDLGQTVFFQPTLEPPCVDDAPAQERTRALLGSAYAVMNEIATTYHPCTLLDRILETAMPAINAQRGAIFLSNNDTALGPCQECGKVHRIRDGLLVPADPGEMRISESVARRVLEEGESVLYDDTTSEKNGQLSESILSLDLRSILCVPLRAKHGILGILYADSNCTTQHCQEEDLLLASAVGNSAGIALENALMHRQILEKQRMEQEIATAWTIQEGFLVKEWPEAETAYEVFGQTWPAKTVGGDFYDFVQPAPGRVGLLIGDVSGKGVPAALTMAQLLAEFRLLAREEPSPAAVLTALNAGLCARSQRGMFCTLCYLTLELDTGKLVYANAGHNPFVRVRANEITEQGEASGPPVGILPNPSWQDEEGRLEKGDALVLYTDGITEARKGTMHDKDEAEREEYDSARLMVAAQSGRAPKALIQGIHDDVLRFCAPNVPHDDCTMIGLRYLG